MVRVTVIGAGVLGIKIAGSLAHDGHEVRIHDNNSSLLNKVYLRLNEDRRILKEDGFLLNSNFTGDIYCFSRMEDAVKGAQFIFECITEDMNLKRTLFKQLEACCSESTILATSSMRLSVDDITENMTTRERSLGVRFLYPVYFVPEVELLPSKHTSIETLEKVRQFLERMGRVAFFRSGNEPIVLNEDQREARKSAVIRQMNEMKGLGRRLHLPVPDLGGNNSAVNGNDNSGECQSPITREKECVVCMDNDRDCVLHPCHHLCTCISCGRLLLKRQDACPICRRTITNAFRVYHS